MEGTYGVYFGSQQAGKVQVLRQGLYYCIHCRCRLTGAVICRLEVSCGDKRENLGVLVPVDGGFGLDTKIPAKRLKEGKPQFVIVAKHEKGETVFIPIYPDEPFAYIERLKDGFLSWQNGQAGVVLKTNGT